jgi:type I restriction enzyme R subunit
MLVAMATGTGKTRTCVALMYRLLKHKRFRRILFGARASGLAEAAEGGSATAYPTQGELQHIEVARPPGLS